MDKLLKLSKIVLNLKNGKTYEYTRYLNAQKSKEKMQHINTDILEHQGAEYQNTIKNKEDKKFEGLW